MVLKDDILMDGSIKMIKHSVEVDIEEVQEDFADGNDIPMKEGFVYRE